VDIATGNDSVQSMAIQADGAVWLAGLSYNGSDHDYSLVRLRADGTLDTRFSEDGKALFAAGIVPDDGWSLAVQADGKWLVAGLEWSPSGTATVVSRFNPDGTADTTFGAGGSTEMAAGTGTQFTSLNVQADGKILLAERGETTAEVYRLNQDGALDTAFSGDGRAALQLPDASAYPYDLGFAAQADGKFVVAGFTGAGPSPDFSVSRVNTDGTADSSFGTHGTATFDISGSFDYGYAVALQADGKVLVAGASDTGAANDYDMAVVRLNDDGTLDSSFGAGGQATFDIAGEYDAAQALSVLADGKILLGGQSNLAGDADFATLRINADGSLDTTFGALDDGVNHLEGSSGRNLLIGGKAAETINGRGGDDLIDGGGGRDILTGGTGADVFRFSSIEGSYRTASENGADRIRDFDPSHDLIDLSALGFSGLGNGHDGTLALMANSDGSRTYLKDFDTDTQGRRFEVSLNGDLAGALDARYFVFAPAGDAAAPQLLGAAPDDYTV
jgi:uncharacterized delta-60 repeat protein